MTRKTSEPKTVTKTVVVFDICSSTTILENLQLNERLKRWRNLIIGMKNFLRTEAPEVGFKIYKFIGDGWILLFPEDFGGDELIQFLSKLSKEFRYLYRKVDSVLTTRISTIGLTFGIEKGTLIYLTMNKKPEYIGRPLNVATRLQSSLKVKDKNPQYKGLISRVVYDDFSRETKRKLKKTHKIVKVERDLQNIAGGNKYPCMKLRLPLLTTKKSIR